MKNILVINSRVGVSIIAFFWLSLLGMVLLSQIGSQIGHAFASEVTLCECANEPIKTDEKALACGQLIERLGPEVVATETMKCRETLPVPEGGPDICFCMRSNSKDPEIQQACMALINSMSSSSSELFAITQECARKQYQ